MNAWLAVIATTLILTTPRLSQAEHERPGFEAPSPPIECWYEQRYFYPAFGNPVNYCRGHLRFEPGAADCYTFTDQVCWVFSPEVERWVETHVALPPQVITCPASPKPPQCPEFRTGGSHRGAGPRFR